MAQEHFSLSFFDKVHEYLRHRKLQTVQAKFGSLRQVTVCHGTMRKSRLKQVGSKFLNCLLKITFEGRVGMHNLLMA